MIYRHFDELNILKMSVRCRCCRIMSKILFTSNHLYKEYIFCMYYMGVSKKKSYKSDIFLFDENVVKFGNMT